VKSNLFTEPVVDMSPCLEEALVIVNVGAITDGGYKVEVHHSDVLVNGDFVPDDAEVLIDVVQEGVAPTNEVQVVTVSNATGGTFTLTFESATTDAIAYNASAAAVQAALEALSTIGTGNVAVTGNAGGPWTVTFQNDLGGTDVAQMTADGTNLEGEGATVSVSTTTEGTLGVNEQQSVTLHNAAGGTFILSFENEETDPIAYNAAAADVEAALSALSTIGSGNVAVTGEAGGPWTVTFQGDLASTDVDLLVGDKNTLVGGSTAIPGAITDEFTSASDETCVTLRLTNYKRYIKGVVRETTHGATGGIIGATVHGVLKLV
jgi:hypothetical protein